MLLKMNAVSLSLGGLLPCSSISDPQVYMHTDNTEVSGERKEAEHRSDAFSVTKSRASINLFLIAAITYHAHRPSQG